VIIARINVRLSTKAGVNLAVEVFDALSPCPLHPAAGEAGTRDARTRYAGATANQDLSSEALAVRSATETAAQPMGVFARPTA
jgi:hypothetical protein